HADAAAGDAGYGRRGAETRRQDEAVELRVAQRFGFRFADKAKRDRPLANLARVEPAPVVADLDNDEAALVEGGKPDRAGLALAGGEALFRLFDAVVR